ncbi:uncharacterized protein TM35_000191070 [Trypanosoma theileri]|uniref:Uncharacterized protein n=1 Tax=Trypanosoma theileri TaxID=67003 RepID=A0A1X0NTR1_9TRYP|nr:uncharacterized protein TM35_000191070 [Trypanosoma theileri]ORC87863.1 hypothetical protein TM35_000191070 [Trypanosoma theileri]
MACVVDHHTLTVNDSETTAIVTKEPAELPPLPQNHHYYQPEHLQEKNEEGEEEEAAKEKTRYTGRNVFTFSHASIHPNAAAARAFLDAHIPQPRTDMDTQRANVQQHHLERLHAFVERSELRNVLGDAERVVGLKSLVRLAAETDLHHAGRCQYPPDVQQFMRRTWQALLLQVDAHFAAAPPTADRSREALENISGLGVWFTGNMSLPLRRHAVRIPAPDGTMQDAIAIGIAAFTYSSYVMEARRQAQTATLAELDRLSKRLNVKLCFLPPLVLPEEAPRDLQEATLTDNIDASQNEM